MSYHNTSSTTSLKKINNQGLLAPDGFHYMPDGTLMSDAAHKKLYQEKTIKAFNINTKNLKAIGESRTINIAGENGASFNLEIQNGAKAYYNFQTRIFQTQKTKLSATISNNNYVVTVVFPTVSSADQYNFSLFSGENTTHGTYREVRLADGSLDINSSTGSNSNLIQKVIFQTLDVTATLGVVGGIGATFTSSTITVPVGSSKSKIPFTIKYTATNAVNSFEIIRQPVAGDVAVFVDAVVGAPIAIPGENIYPQITTAVDTTNNGGTRVDSTNDAEITMYVVASTVAKVGDRVTQPGTQHALNSSVVTVTSVSGGTGKTFEISPVVEIADDLALTFSSQQNFRWPISSTSQNLSRLLPGMAQLDSDGQFFSGIALISDYLEQVTIFENEANEYKVDKVFVPAIDFRGIKPTITRHINTKVVTEIWGTAANAIHVTFDKQAKLLFQGSNAKIFSTGEDEIYRILGWDVEFTDLKATLSPVVTNTSSSTIGASSTTVGVDSRIGIVDGISTVSGIGINPGAANPTVVSGANSQSASGNIVLSSAQELEDNAKLTFANASREVTITGFVKVNDTSDKDIILRIQLDKFLIQH